MDTSVLFDKVRKWGVEVGITGSNGKGTRLKQLDKMLEEAEETKTAVLALHDAGDGSRAWEIISEIEDGIGDTMVTLILLAELHGLRAEDCLASAYRIISRRTGTMIDGQFVKNSPDNIL
jgi:hypothetical protein